MTREPGRRLAGGGPVALRRLQRVLPALARPHDDVHLRPCGRRVPLRTSTPPRHRKIDFFADRVLPTAGGRVLDVGCGWGGALRRFVQRPGVAGGVGLTLSPAQVEHVAADPIPGAEVRLQSWTDHAPSERYDAIVSFGAFEHFARDGTTGPERIETYRRFFARCHGWLVPGGRLGLETIAHDGAPDTSRPLGRGPLGDFVLEIFPESICPHLSELVLGFEPWFEVELLQSDAADFARTCRAWQVGLRQHDDEAVSAGGG